MKKSTFREYFESIGLAILAALFLRTFVVEAFKIPSGSMMPTLIPGDHIFVNKFIYGFRIPWTFVKFLEFTKPGRGDVIVFIKPKENDKDFIKRVIGIEGDLVVVRNGELFINGNIVPNKKDGSFKHYDSGDQYSNPSETIDTKYRETIDGKTFNIILRDNQSFRNDGEFFVEPGTVFVMGDNRDNSSDSRVWGLVPLDHIKGKAMFIWWAWDSRDKLLWKRLFSWIN